MMYQTAVISETRLSRKAGPVCITLLAMRPAKSFWKKAQLCRTTCQWLCQRIMLATLAAIAWFMTRFCAVSASGRPISSTAAMPSSIGSDSASSLSGWLEVTSVTTRPIKTGMVASSSATMKPVMNSSDEQPFRLAGKVPVEGGQARRRLRTLRHLGRIQGFFEQLEHDGLKEAGRHRRPG